MMDDYDQDPSFWDLPSGDGEEVDCVVSLSDRNREGDDDDRDRISWKDEDDSIPSSSQEDFQSLDHSEGSGHSSLSSQLGDSSHHRQQQGYNDRARIALVSPGTSMTSCDTDDSDNDMDDDDRFVASLVTSESNYPEFPSLHQKKKRSNEKAVGRLATSTDRSNDEHISPRHHQHFHYFPQPTLESLEQQYKRTMKKLILSIERTDETRTFFKRQRIDRRSFVTMTSWESLHFEESRKALQRTLLKDCGALPVVPSHL